MNNHIIPWHKQELPGLQDLEQKIKNIDGAKKNSQIIRGHAKKLLDEGKISDALGLPDRYIEYIEKIKSKQTEPFLNLFYVFLHETKGWLVNRLPPDKKSEYLSIGISSVKTALEAGKGRYGFSLYDHLQSLGTLSNLIANMPIKSMLEELTKLKDKREEVYKEKLSWTNNLNLNELIELSRFNIGLNNIYYKASRERKYLRFSLEAKRVLIDSLQRWINFFYPNNKQKLDYKSIPIAVAFNKLKWEEVEKKLRPHQRNNDETARKIKELLGELLYRATKTYSKLGHHNMSHYIFRITNIYGFGIKGPLKTRLDYTKEMAEIEENENILKALDRLESMLPEVEGLQKDLKRKRGYNHHLYRLYRRIGFEKMADSLAKSFSLTIPQKKDRTMKKCIELVEKRVEQENPLPIIHSIEDLAKKIRREPEEALKNAEQLKGLIKSINDFIVHWIQYSEIKKEEFLQPDLLNLNNEPQRYTEALFNLALNLCQIYNHALSPQFLRHLGMSQKELNNPLWIETLIDSLIQSAKFGDPHNFLKSFRVIKEDLLQDKNNISKDKRAMLFKNTILLGEKIIERILFFEERNNFIEKFSNCIDIATFGLKSLNTENKESWIFRGANLFKSRSLTALRLELPHRSEIKKEDWLELKNLLIEENESATEREEDFIEDIKKEEETLEKKYKLLCKNYKWGIGGCSPNILKKALNLNKKISVVSFLISGEKILIAGLSNHNEMWSEIIKAPKNINELPRLCWGDIEYEHTISNLKKAFSDLIEPIMSFIEESELLYIIPDGNFCNLPFHSLIDGEERFLIERYEIAYIQHPMLLWGVLKANFAEKNGNLAFGYLEKDVNWKKGLPEDKDIITTDSPEEGFKMLKNSYFTRKLLYIIGHGYPPEEGKSPFDAYIKLSDDDKIKITAGEFLELGPKANFVFLNSCHLGQSSIYGRDIYGFPFSIIGAGNSSCLVSAVSVDIEFAYFFANSVLQNLFNGMDRSRAVAKTIRECISNSRWNLPYYWAPYFFYGDFRPLCP